VRVRFIGERERFGAGLVRCSCRTAHRRQHPLTLSIAASYGGRQDIARAARALAAEVAAGRLAREIDESLRAARSLADLPPPDLFIRTGGDTRISNFLLWQLAYTELWFTEALWPDFDAGAAAALDAYAGRERRFGLTSAQSPAESIQPMTKTRVLAALIMAPLAIAAILLLPTAGWPPPPRGAADRPVGMAEAGRHRRHPAAPCCWC
jgi:hypothetical protein